MQPRTKLLLIGLASFALIAAYLWIDLGSDWRYALTRRTLKVLAVILTGSSIAFSTVVFQTITHNRILTPSIIGMDSLYGLIQTTVVFFFGATHMLWVNEKVHFAVSTGLMALFAGVIYRALFRRENFNIYFVLLVGMIMGVFFQSFASFMEMLIDPNEFLVAQGRMFGSFNNVRTGLIAIAFTAVGLVAAYFYPIARILDVLALGRDHAINLGVDYNPAVRRLWIVVSGLVAISTALVGPVTFLGLLVANVTYELLKTHRHALTIPGAMLVSVAALMGALIAVERVFSFNTTVSVIVNFVGSLYFIYIVLKESQS